MAESLSSGFCLSRRIPTTQPFLGAQLYNVHQYGNITPRSVRIFITRWRDLQRWEMRNRALSPPFSFLGRRVFDDHLTMPSSTLMRSLLHHNNT